MPREASIRDCSTKDGNTFSSINKVNFSGNPELDVQTYQKKVLDSIQSIIRNDSDPDYTVPTVLNNDGLLLQLDFKSGNEFEGNEFDNVRIQISHRTISFIDDAQMTGGTSADMETINTGTITGNYSFTTGAFPSGNVGIYTATYNYSPTTGDLILTVTNSFDTTIHNITVNLPTLFSRIPAGSLLANTAFSDFTISGSYIGTSITSFKPPNTSFFTEYFDYISNYQFTWVGWTADSSPPAWELSVDVYVSKNSETGAPLYIFYDPIGTQTPAPSKAFLAGVLANDPTYVEGGTNPTNLDYFEKLACYFFGPLQGSSKFIYDNSSTDTFGCEDSEGPSAAYCGKDPCEKKSIQVLIK